MTMVLEKLRVNILTVNFMVNIVCFIIKMGI